MTVLALLLRDIDTRIHKFGHNFGLSHANGNAAEYGGALSMMGGDGVFPEPWRVSYPGEGDRAHRAHTSPGCSGEREGRCATHAASIGHGRAAWGMKVHRARMHLHE